ncbi:MAG: HAD-IIIA family hydrolase [Chloroflexi bacterium]|nr:HAD-IIIA family hydrolase [Chloroflexota bacterium]
MRPAIFLDRDGVLNENRTGYVRAVEHIRWLPGAREALRVLAAFSYPLVVITNQSGVARGLLSQDELADIHETLRRDAVIAGGRIDAFYCCPRLPESGCVCRKPAPGLLLQAAQELSLDLGHSVFVGDVRSDFEAARSAGVAFIHVRSGLDSDFPEVAAEEGIAVPSYAGLLDAVPYCLHAVGAYRGESETKRDLDRSDSPR